MTSRFAPAGGQSPIGTRAMPWQTSAPGSSGFDFGECPFYPLTIPLPLLIGRGLWLRTTHTASRIRNLAKVTR
jgi:hypothetical protein